MEIQVNGLTRFGLMAKAHWEKFRPKMVAHLKRELVYKSALLNAQEMATQLIGEEVSKLGNSLENAREKALALYILLPSEEEQPTLEVDRMPYSQPEPTIESLTQIG